MKSLKVYEPEARARLSYRAALWVEPSDSLPRARLSLLVSRLTSMPMPPMRSVPS